MAGIRHIPVFVSPTELKFYVSSKSTHKQLLTILNPYEVPVKFKVLSTAPKKYTVAVPEGSIGSQMLVDIVIRHNTPTEANVNVTDKFRISIHDHTTNRIMGKKDVEATLLSVEADMSKENDFKSLPNNTKESSVDGTSLPYRSPEQRTNKSNYYVPISAIVMVICIALMCLPTQQEVMPPSIIPEYLHLSSSFKMGLAYVLGLITSLGIIHFRTIN